MLSTYESKTRPGSRSSVPGASVMSAVIACCLSILTIVGFVLSSERFYHWFIFPVLACGMLIGPDVVDWFRGRIDALDPAGLLGLIGCHFFFLAPLLHVYWDYWMGGEFVAPPADWRDWLGWMAVINAVGLLLYRATRKIPTSQLVPTKRRWTLDYRRFWVVLPVALALSAALQVAVYSRYGGISGFVQSFAQLNGAFDGMGAIFMVSESAPILGVIGFVVWARNRRLKLSWFSIGLVLLAFLFAQVLFGGLRGSRANIVLSGFWAVGIFHFWIKPVPKKIIYAGTTLMLLFLYLYGFYKAAGLDALQAFEGAQSREELQQRTGRTFESMLLGDLGRSDVQAYVLYRLMMPGRDYQYVYGGTYVGAVTFLIPRFIMPDRPPAKLKAGTEVQHGVGTFVPIVGWYSQRIYGLAGETMLNFGPWAVPVAFIVFGLAVRRVRTWFATWHVADVRVLFLPFLVTSLFIFLTSDLDNVTFFLVKSAGIPFLVVLASSRIQLVDEAEVTRA